VRTTGLCELTLETPDPRALAAFYGRVLNLAPLSEEDDRIWLACGPNSRLGLGAKGARRNSATAAAVTFASPSPSGGGNCWPSRTGSGSSTSSTKGPVEHPGGDHSLYFADPEGNVVEVWDFFEDGDGAEEGVMALAEGNDGA
jgi:catechol-2,3-dioxygenase